MRGQQCLNLGSETGSSLVGENASYFLEGVNLDRSFLGSGSRSFGFSLNFSSSVPESSSAISAASALSLRNPSIRTVMSFFFMGLSSYVCFNFSGAVLCALTTYVQQKAKTTKKFKIFLAPFRPSSTHVQQKAKLTKKISDFFQCCFGLHLLMFSRRQNRQKKFQIFFSTVSAFIYSCSAEGENDKKNFRFFSVPFWPSSTHVQQKTKTTKLFQIFFQSPVLLLKITFLIFFKNFLSEIAPAEHRR